MKYIHQKQAKHEFLRKKQVVIFLKFCCAAPEIRIDFVYTMSDLTRDLVVSYGHVQTDKCQPCVKMVLRTVLCRTY